jgi:[ribosomal protein S5]-alanine N-acetyltransferase
MYITLHTNRLTIRPIRTDDDQFILALLNSPGWLRFIGERNVRTETDAQQYIEKILGNPNYFYSVFQDQKSGEPIGIITYLYRETLPHPDIGFATLPAFEGKGYTYEATRSYLDAIIRNATQPQTQLDKEFCVLGIAMTDNTASTRLLEKLGLQRISEKKEQDKLVSTYALKV